MATPLLLDKTKLLLKQSMLEPVVIAAGANVSYDWLIKLKSDKIKDPSVNKVQAVYEYLSERPLFTE